MIKEGVYINKYGQLKEIVSTGSFTYSFHDVNDCSGKRSSHKHLTRNGTFYKNEWKPISEEGIKRIVIKNKLKGKNGSATDIMDMLQDYWFSK